MLEPAAEAAQLPVPPYEAVGSLLRTAKRRGAPSAPTPSAAVGAPAHPAVHLPVLPYEAVGSPLRTAKRSGAAKRRGAPGASPGGVEAPADPVAQSGVFR